MKPDSPMSSTLAATPSDTRWDRAADLLGAGLRSLFVSLGLFLAVGTAGMLALMIVDIGVRSPKLIAIAVAGLLIQMPQMLLMMVPVSLVALPLLGAVLRGRGRIVAWTCAILGALTGHLMAIQPYGKPAFGVLGVLLGPILMGLGLCAGFAFLRALRRYEAARP